MSLEKYFVLLWKNWTIQKRHWKSGIFEVIFPVIFIIIFTWMKSLYMEGGESRLYIDDNRLESIWECQYYLIQPSKIVYSPTSPWLEEFLQNALGTNPNFPLELDGFENSQALDAFLLSAMPNQAIGIEFDDSLKNSTSRPNIFSYSLRFPDDYYGGFLSECFYAMQNDLENAFISIFTEANPPEIQLKSFTYYSSIQDDIIPILKTLVPLLLIFSTFFTVTKIIKNVTIERESQLKESMRIMGLSNTLNWSAWLTSSFLIILLAYTLVSIFLSIKIVNGQALFEYSNLFLIWIFFSFYIIAVITFCFLISVIFKKASTAGKVGAIIFFLTYVFYYQFGNDFASFNYAVKLLFCLPLNTGLGQGVSMFFDMEKSRVGLQFSNFGSRDNDLRFSIADVLLAFVLASVIHMLLTTYIEQVFSGSIGISKPWNFPILWLVNLFRKSTVIDDEEIKKKSELSSKDFETDPQNMKAGIKIVDITKRFSKATVVNQFTLNMYEDQITVLLGHNGAGKTTTLNMLTGMFAPTSGTAFLNNYDIRTDIDEARKSLGLCPQHNILFDDLTVREHFIFFCRLKGLKKEAIKAEISKYVTLLDFNDKINALSKTLSGGQKRKLSIGVALCGGSKIVMLDEPTSGLDAGARRALWNLLIEEKKGRTILLTTHHMDEADILGDRIAIMNNGELQTVGSSFFLKKRFGSGYKLICVKNQGCNPTDILKVLKEFVPDVRLDSDAQTEAVFIINEDYILGFPKMFREIEGQSERLKISSFGFSLTTLEEVFIKVGSNRDKSSSDQDIQFTDFVPSRKVSGSTAVLYQIYAIILKKFHYTRRNLYPIGWLTLVSAALMYIFLVAPIDFDSPFNEDVPLTPQNISPSILNGTVVGVAHDGSNTGLLNNYISLFTEKDIVEEVYSFEDYILKKYQTSQEAEHERFLIGSTINSGNITAWFQSYRLPTILKVLSLNTIHRAILKTVAGSELDIMVANKPYNFTYDYPSTTEGTPVTEEYLPTEETIAKVNEEETIAKVNEEETIAKVNEEETIAKVNEEETIAKVHEEETIAKVNEDETREDSKEDELTITSKLINFILIFLMFYFLSSYWPSIFIAMKVKERKTKAKLLQLISGTNRFIYWLTSFIVDYIILLVIMYVIVGIVALNQRAYFRTGTQIGNLIAIISFYGFSAIPFIYTLSFLFVKHATAETMIPVHGLICGVIYLVYTLIKYLLRLDILADIVYWIMLFFAPFSLLDCFVKITIGSIFPYVPKEGEKELPNHAIHFGTYGVAPNILLSIISGILFMSICLCLDHMVFERIVYKIKWYRQNLPTKTMVDDDVMNETENIKSMPNSDISNASLVLQGLSKFYGKNLAVNQLYLRVSTAECFGLLGINGAGKTSTFQMLTGDVMISRGDVWIQGKSMKKNIISAQKSIGYCPQFDALMFDLSGRENLKIFSLIRGIPMNEIDKIIDKIARELGFHMHLDKKIKAYSGGNKRKISTALSLLGDPNLIFLDEPTTGIDPYSKRHLWTIINKIRNSGKSVILTSHSMDECEALCTRIAIMVAGEFKCLGSAQHLKNKFSKGFILTIKMKQDDESQLLQIQNVLRKLFPSLQLKEKYMDLLTFHIPSESLKWSEVFGNMSELQSEVAINDFTVTQMSLEQVFLHFTKDDEKEMGDV